MHPQSTPDEEWRPCWRYEGVYEASSLGRVRRVARHPSAKPNAYIRVKTRRNWERTGRVLTEGLDPNNGCLTVALSWKNKRTTWLVHTLIANTFIGPCPPDKESVRHLNEDKTDNRACNLAWESGAERRARYWGPKPQPRPRRTQAFVPKVNSPPLLGRAGRAMWAAIKERYGHRCVYCKTRRRALTMDHLVPLAAGGPNTWDNIVPACMACNVHKSAGAAPPFQLNLL
jgi:hypothetical protein